MVIYPMRRPATKSNRVPTKKSTWAMARSRFQVWLLAVLLALVTMAVYWPATRHDFVDYDDDVYVTSNFHVQAGLTLAGLKWAFINPVCSNWHPLTMLSHMCDCQMFGLKPWGHHLTNILLHAANTVLVFLLLRGLTGTLWRSWVVAALFGLHPVHVESVAWVAERKDVLSACFGLIALLFYSRYARKRSLPNPQPSKLDYTLSLFFLALGLMSKPMLVTWPFVMLLLDYWPLERWRMADGGAQNAQVGKRKPAAGDSSTLNSQLSTTWRLVWEKIPFFALAAVASVIAYFVQKHGGAMQSIQNLSLGVRDGNALISYCRYLGKLFWPTKLAVFYPYPGHWPLAELLLAGGLLIGLSTLFFLQRRRCPFLLMGWLWFVGTLVPVIGLVQVGEQAMADRYLYIPSLGVLIVVIWGLYELTRHWRYQATALSVAGSAAIVLCTVLTWRQLGYWQDSEALFGHALEVTENNHIARFNLGVVRAGQGRLDEAISEFQEAIRLNPYDAKDHNNLGVALDKQGRSDEAIGQYQEAIRLKPDYADAHNNLGAVLDKQGRSDEAISQYQEAIRLKPDYPDAYNNLGVVLDKQGRSDEAISQFQEAIRLKPDYADAHNNLGNALIRKGQINEAISQLQETIRLKPDAAEAHYNLGDALARQGQIDEAISQFQEAIRLKPDDADAHNYLGITLARIGRIDEAISQLQETVRLKPDYAEAHNNLGAALARNGRIDEATSQFQEAIRLKPDYAEAHDNLARALKMQHAPAGH
jgi:Flp pilus assembly protein TadD